MPWTPKDQQSPSYQITDAQGNLIDVTQHPLQVGEPYDYRADVAGAPQHVQMRALTQAQYTSNQPRDQSHLLSATAVVSVNAVEASFTPTQAMADASPIRLGFVQDPTTLPPGDPGTGAWGVGGIVVTVQ